MFSFLSAALAEEASLEELHLSLPIEDQDTCSVILEKNISVPEKIDQISFLEGDEAQNCLEALKASVFQNSNILVTETPARSFSELSLTRVNTRIRQLIQSLNSPELKADQPFLAEVFQNKIAIIMTQTIFFSFRSNFHSSDYFAINALTDLSIKDMNSEIRKFQSSYGSKGFIKKIENNTMSKSNETSPLTQNNTELENAKAIESEAKNAQKQFGINVYVEFPVYFVCEKKEKIPELTHPLISSFQKHEKALYQFIKDHPEFAEQYKAAANTVSSIMGYNTFSLEQTGSQLIFSLNHNSEYRQAIMQFLSDQNQEGFQNNLSDFFQMEKTYNFTKQFIAEYLECLPQSFQERLFISSFNPYPVAIADASKPSLYNAENPTLENIVDFIQSLGIPEENSNKQESKKPSVFNIQYELRSQSNPLLYSYTKGEEAHIVVQTSALNLQNSNSNEINERYDSGWASDLESIADFKLLEEASL